MRFVPFDRVKRLISLSDVLRLLSWRPTISTPTESRGPCPIHGSGAKRPRSFCVSDRAWYCHSCRRGGDQIDLWAAVKGVPLGQAAAELCDMMGIPSHASAAPR